MIFLLAAAIQLQIVQPIQLTTLQGEDITARAYVVEEDLKVYKCPAGAKTYVMRDDSDINLYYVKTGVITPHKDVSYHIVCIKDK